MNENARAIPGAGVCLQSLWDQRRRPSRAISDW